MSSKVIEFEKIYAQASKKVEQSNKKRKLLTNNGWLRKQEISNSP